MKSIELDCPPGTPRPGDLIDAIVKGTQLEGALPRPSMFFGNWTWHFDSVSDDDWVKIQEVTKLRIIRLYQQGVIRYGSW